MIGSLLINSPFGTKNPKLSIVLDDSILKHTGVAADSTDSTSANGYVYINAGSQSLVAKMHIIDVINALKPRVTVAAVAKA